MKNLIGLLVFSSVIFAQDTPVVSKEAGALQAAVMARENQFAATMAKRDFAGFSNFVSAEAVFFTNGKILRGKETVLAEWQPLFGQREAPFAWFPETVEVLASGTLAVSSGPVRDPQGTLIATYTSVWRLEGDGCWRVVFDQGNRITAPGINANINQTTEAKPASDAVGVVQAFIAAVNRKSVAELRQLMSDDHTFIDPQGHTQTGRDSMVAAWQAYFAMFPDYRISAGSCVAEGDFVAVFGQVSGTYKGARGLVPENRIVMPAAWRAHVRNGQVVVWQVYADWSEGLKVIERERGSRSKAPEPKSASGSASDWPARQP